MHAMEHRSWGVACWPAAAAYLGHFHANPEDGRWCRLSLRLPHSQRARRRCRATPGRDDGAAGGRRGQQRFHHLHKLARTGEIRLLALPEGDQLLAGKGRLALLLRRSEQFTGLDVQFCRLLVVACVGGGWWGDRSRKLKDAREGRLWRAQR